MSRAGASRTAVECEQEDEQVGWREKEMRDEPSIPPRGVVISRLNDSIRLSEEGGQNTHQ